MPGSFGFEYGDSFATYLGWLIPWGAPLTLIGETAEQIAAAQRDLARIGIDRLAGAPFTQRDASARTFDHVFSRGTPRDPQTWATVAAQPVPAWMIDYVSPGKALGYLGKDIGPGIIEHARQMGSNSHRN